MPMEKRLSSGHEIPDEEGREHDLEEKDQKKDENEEDEDEDEAEEEMKPNEAGEEEGEEEDKEDKEEECKDSPDSNSGDQSEFMDRDLGGIYKAVQCPICLGIIKKTKTMMECLHRFCQECIEKSMRLGNKECPACRIHCPRRRSLRDDPNFDALIAAVFTDIESYEKEEMNEDQKARNKEIQESIAQVSERRKRKKGSTSRGTEEEVET